ncbi:YfdX family protein [Poseidonocella sp. HB161398]|uniref:YfdX family protein n=1 Tax=Poseidonocella sp. HB161398 TaxID=2320855 RepID=UPI001485FC0B|nr:YfdX family protein [Poseidonocella sp. HB161398]
MAQRSKFGRKVAILVASTAILASPMATIAVAAENAKTADQSQAQPAQSQSAKPDADYATQDEFLKVSDEGLSVLSKVHQARAELYDGQTDAAAKLLDDAGTALDSAKGDLHQMLVADTSSGSDEPVLLPVDVQIGYGETFVPDEASNKAISEAGAQMQANEPDKALETLRMAELDMRVIAAMMPLDATAAHISDAQKAIGTGDTASAETSLAALEDGVVVQGWTIDAIPRQGDGSVQQSSAAGTVGGMQEALPGQPAQPATAVN